MITLHQLRKSYGAVEALKGISLDIREGEFYGLLGPNGAGKTTTISIMSTIVQPDSGEVTIAGVDIRKDPVHCKRTIGVVPQEIALYNDLSAYDNLMFWGSLYDIPSAQLKSRIDTTLDLFGLLDRKNDKVKTYSGGMKRRINIAAALLHNPKILFMDEPTVGIDPQSRNLIFEVVEKLHREGMTLVYTTHYMEEAERYCDRIAIIDHGRIVAQGTLDELKKTSASLESIVVTFAVLPDETVVSLQRDWPTLKHLENVIHFYSTNIKADISRIVIRCSELGLDVQRIDIQKVNLETVFLNLTGRQLRD